MYKGQDDKGNLTIWWLDSFLKKKNLGSCGNINTFVLVYMGIDSTISIDQHFEKYMKYLVNVYICI